MAIYQLGEQAEAIRTLKKYARKYRDFPDVRAALTAALWQNGQRGEAESNWIAAIGFRCSISRSRLGKNNRRWPPVDGHSPRKLLKFALASAINIGDSLAMAIEKQLELEKCKAQSQRLAAEMQRIYG